MKNFLKEVRDSFYNPSFYKEISQKTNTHVFKYIFYLSISLAIIASIASLILIIFKPDIATLPNSFWPFAVSSIFIAHLIAAYIIVYVSSLVFGLVIFLITKFYKIKITYDNAQKLAVYSMTPAFIVVGLMVILKIEFYIDFLALILTIVFFFLNYRNELRSIVK